MEVKKNFSGLRSSLRCVNKGQIQLDDEGKLPLVSGRQGRMNCTAEYFPALLHWWGQLQG